MNAPEPRTFDRVVESDPPTVSDFISYAALGKPLRKRNPTPGDVASWRAVSTYVTEYEARKRAELNNALGFPIGDIIAKLVLPDNASVRIGHTNRRTGHCDLAGDPAVLLAAAVSVVRV